MHSHYLFAQVKQLFILLFAITLLGFSTSLSAHEIRPSIIDISFDETGAYKMAIKTNLEAMIAKVGTQYKNTNDSKNAAHYDTLRQMPYDVLIEEFSKFEPSLVNEIQLNFNEKRQALTIESVDIPDIGDLDLARDSVINFVGTMPANTKTLSWQWGKDFGNAVLRISSHQNKELYSSYLLDGKVSDKIIIEGLTPPSKWQQFVTYLEVGFVHIVPKGLDHILFVVGLFLLSTQLRPLLIQITTFTLAHSVTLALGIYGVINISPSIVEPLIAASIIYVAVENIFMDKLSRWRPVIVFFFGLLHGLGFASVLKEIGLESSNFVTGLVAFNIGVELGQLTVVTVCFLTVGLWFSHKEWYRQRITIPASIIIAIIASYWLVERTLLA